MDESKNQPVQRIRDGLISVSIWRQEGPTGAFFNVTLERTYTEGEGKAMEWKYTNSLGRYDLLGAAKLLDRAHTWIVREDARLKAEKRAGNENVDDRD